MRTAVLLVTFAAASVVSAAAQVRELTADESVRLGLEHNVRLRAAAADAQAAQAVLREVRAGALPAVRGEAGFTRLSNNIPAVEFTLPGSDSTFTFQAVQLNRYYSQFSVEQPLFTGSRLRNEIRAAGHDARAAELRAQQETSDVAFEIRRAFWELRRAFAVRDALATSLEHVIAHLADVRARFDQGAALRRDVLAAQTRRSEVALERVDAANAVRTGQLELSRLIGLPLDTDLRPAGEPAVDTVVVAIDSLVAIAHARRPQLAALAEQVNSLSAHVRASEGARWPRLDFIGRYTYARPNPYFFSDQTSFRYTWELGLSTRWNIWEGGRQNARTAEQRARLQAAQSRLTDARTRVAVDITRRQLELVRSREAVSVAAQNVAEAEETFRVAREQFGEGAALSADVLDAEEVYRRAQARRAQAAADVAIARAALLNALGEIW